MNSKVLMVVALLFAGSVSATPDGAENIPSLAAAKTWFGGWTLQNPFVAAPVAAPVVAPVVQTTIDLPVIPDNVDQTLSKEISGPRMSRIRPRRH